MLRMRPKAAIPAKVGAGPKHRTGILGYAKGPRIGFVEGDNLYLEPGSMYAALQSFSREQSDAFPLAERTLLKRLQERGVITAADKGRTTLKKSFPDAERLCVVCLAVSTLRNSGANGIDKQEAVSETQRDAPRFLEEAQTGVGLAQKAGQEKSGPAPLPENNRGSTEHRGSQKAQENSSGTHDTPTAPKAPQKLPLDETVQRERDNSAQLNWTLEL